MNRQTPLSWRDTALEPHVRAKHLVAALTLEEKIGQLMMQCPAIPRLGIPAYDWWSEALHGVGRNGIATVFPQAIGLAATWNPELVHRIAEVIATEARAKYHVALREGASGRYQGVTLWSPNVNLFRDPRWGRGQECYGEDVCLTSQMGSAFVRGLQGNHPRYLKTAATPKHFAVHNGPEAGRFSFNAVADDRDIHEEELSVFEFVIRDSKPASVMSAYNAISGTPCASNKWLLSDLLRGEWGFDGAVVGDVDNVANLSDQMGKAADHAEASAMAIQAGQDLCSGWAFQKLGEAIERGLVSEEDLDRALLRNLSVRFRLGQFDPPELLPFTATPASVVDAPDHDLLALQAAQQSVVLLKNDGVLPLDLSRIKKVGILGPTADSRAALLGNYSGVPSKPVNIVEGIRNRFQGVGVIHFRAVPLVKGMERSGKPFDIPGLRAEVFQGADFKGESTPAPFGPDLFWNVYQPLPPIPAENASIRWSCDFMPSASGCYTFTIESIGGFRLVVGGRVLLNELHSKNASIRRSHTVSVELSIGQRANVTLEYRQTCSEGLISLWWKTPLDPVDDLAAALIAAADCDHIILCLGLTPEVEGEEMPVDFEGFKAGDRTTIQLPAPQRELLEAAAALGKPITVILTGGSAISLDIEKANAILCSWYYGQRGGDAIAQILAGDVNPAGRLPVTFYAEDTDLPPFEDYSMDGRTYKFFGGRPLFAFGHGLSYTSFTYGQPRLEKPSVTAGRAMLVHVPVTNTGSRDGEELVQIYARNPNPGLGRPLRQLVGFARTTIAAGVTQEVLVTIDTRLLRRWDASSKRFVYDCGPWILEMGSSSENLFKTASLQVCPAV